MNRRHSFDRPAQQGGIVLGGGGIERKEQKALRAATEQACSFAPQREQLPPMQATATGFARDAGAGRRSEFDGYRWSRARRKAIQPRGEPGQLRGQNGVDVDQAVRPAPPEAAQIVPETGRSQDIVDAVQGGAGEVGEDVVVGSVPEKRGDAQFLPQRRHQPAMAVGIDGETAVAELSGDKPAGVGVMADIASERGIQVAQPGGGVLRLNLPGSGGRVHLRGHDSEPLMSSPQSIRGA